MAKLSEKPKQEDDEFYSDEETAQRRDETLKRMLNTPPKPHKTTKNQKQTEARVCPECGHVFKGNGWDGIDAHWRSKHGDKMPYKQAWPLLKAGTYST